MEMNVGDTVNYVPAMCHALDQDSLGDHAWFFVEKPEPGQPYMTTQEVNAAVNVARVNKQNHKMIPVRPRNHWTAKIKEIGQDGSVTLTDIKGVLAVYECANVPYDPSGRHPHSFHKPKEEIV
jgi:hypothetical protein